jgi:multiple sugar transport system permease protein
MQLKLALQSRRANLIWSLLVLGGPPLLILFVFRIYPIIDAIWIGFHDYNLIAGTMRWVGLGNYVMAIQDASLLKSLIVTLQYFALRVPVQVFLGLSLALLVVNSTRRSGLLRTVVLLPTVMPFVVATAVWAIMYNPDSGVINSALQTIGLPGQKFLNSQDQALPSLVLITVWKFVGTTMVFYLAGLLEIPQTYYEAATVDGANRWQLFRHITFPLLSRSHLYVMVTTTIFALQVFSPIYITTRGGPLNSTRVIVLYIYQIGFDFNRMGYASALSVILALVILAVSIPQWLVNRQASELA